MTEKDLFKIENSLRVELKKIASDSSVGILFRAIFDVYESDKFIKEMIVDERIARIISLRFGLDGSGTKSLGTVARLENITMERVRQLERKGIDILRRKLKDKL